MITNPVPKKWRCEACGGRIVTADAPCNHEPPWAASLRPLSGADGFSARGFRRVVDGAPHGTTSGYCRWQCRCTACRQANAAMQARWKARQRAGLIPG